MLKIAITAVLYAVCFIWVIPALGIGMTVTGGFGTALGMALAFTGVSWVVGKLLQVATLATVGLAGCLVVLLWWAIPAVCLQFTAQLFPQYLTIESFGSAIFAGLVLMVASALGALLAGGRTSVSHSSSFAARRRAARRRRR